MGILTGPSALGSHLSLPGSQDLHHSQTSDNRSFIRHLETINNYITPQPLSDPEGETVTLDEDSAVLSMPVTPPAIPELEPAPAPSPPSLFITTKKKHISSPAIIPKNSAQGHANMGWTFLLDGHPQAALAAYREALRHHPQSANAYVGMGITLKSLGNVEPARQAIQQALELNPQLSSALVHLGYLYADGHVGPSDMKTAHRLFDQAFRLGDPFAGIALLDLQIRSHS
jgi:tetratricopeptide (TPR) repeat protein